MVTLGYLLSSISIVLVLLTLNYSMVSARVSRVLDCEMPPANDKKGYAAYRKEVVSASLLSIGVTVGFFAVTYILAPRTAVVLATSHLNLTDFDELKTLFVAIELGLVILTMVSLRQTVQIFKKLMEKRAFDEADIDE